ncbi:MAG TPA: hypothetical protein VNO82_25930 [Solirubrobacteraceae bacterium]|nr:hypothetical protein [Solirubrobacteraceae bacterium]
MTLETLLVVGAGAVLAPLLVVVVGLLLGMLSGRELGVAEAGGFLQGLAGLGLAVAGARRSRSWGDRTPLTRRWCRCEL